ncbi:MAG: PilX N-terminal domain-containing pilus assembly protein [Pseudomonadales bacterium]|nr:PilX N-terminal domain-containing pilus assembly protein [Pseudomonadales bacterium]
MNHSKAQQQCGAALIIGLIFLLLMSIMALSSLQDVTIQERIGGNSVDNYRAFQSAEVALASAEQATGGVNFDYDFVRALTPGNGWVPMSNAELLLETNWVCDDSSLKDGTLANEKKLCVQSVTLKDPNVTKIPKVKYEQFDSDSFRITVWAEGVGRSRVVLQSIYVR